MSAIAAVQAAPRVVLATDLDGTFLGGSEAQRRELYDRIEKSRDDMLLIFVTGRDLPFIRTLHDEQGVPVPDFIIGDVGTTVVHGRSHEPVPPVQEWIRSRWGSPRAQIVDMLKDEPGIRPQPIDTGCRVSYFYDDALTEATPQKIRDAGYDCIVSGGIYLDVLPRGISKGPTLRRLVDHLGLPKEAVVTAGDTLNDLSLFQTEFNGVAMGNSEDRLVEAIRGMKNVYHSPQPGAAGILDGLQFHGRGL